MSNGATGGSPDFIGIGVMKAATSWIGRCLVEHPSVVPPATKELSFFDRDYNYRRGLDAYRAQFPRCAPGSITGEYSPHYMYSPVAMERIRSVFPDVKLLACLRDPVARAYSQYRYEHQVGARCRVYATFREAAERDADLVSRGLYAVQLERVFAHFPAEQVHIMLYDDIRQAPASVIRELYTFLGIDPEIVPSSLYQSRNPTGTYTVRSRRGPVSDALFRMRAFVSDHSIVGRAIERSGLRRRLRQWVRNKEEAVMGESVPVAPLRDEDAAWLRARYDDDIQRLATLMGRDLSAWRMPPPSPRGAHAASG